MSTNDLKSTSRRTVLRQLLTGAVAGGLLIPAAAHAEIVQGRTPGEEVDNKIGRVINAGNDLGFRHVVADDRGVMYVDGGPAAFRVRLQPGIEYRFSARADNDCIDLDLALIHPNGRIVREDVDFDATPAFDSYVPNNGVYTLRLTLISARTRRVHVGAVVLARGTGPVVG